MKWTAPVFDSVNDIFPSRIASPSSVADAVSFAGRMKIGMPILVSTRTPAGFSVATLTGGSSSTKIR